MKTSKITEKHGFDIIHGIVDSIWITEVDNIEYPLPAADSTYRYINLKKDIEEQTGFSISLKEYAIGSFSIHLRSILTYLP